MGTPVTSDDFSKLKTDYLPIFVTSQMKYVYTLLSCVADTTGMLEQQRKTCRPLATQQRNKADRNT